MPAGSRYAVIAPRARQEALRRILGVDPALDRVPAEHDVLLRDGQLSPRGDEDLLPHEVEARDHLGDRVLHLDPGVHLEEVVRAVCGEEALHGAGGAVADGRGRVDGDRPMRSRSAASTAGDGVSSTSFWWRRWMVQSRSPRWITFPCASASTCTSTWRGSSR